MAFQTSTMEKMRSALYACDIPEKLSVEEIDALCELCIRGEADNGRMRARRLGKWYPIIQMRVNCEIAEPYKKGWIANVSEFLQSRLEHVCRY